MKISFVIDPATGDLFPGWPVAFERTADHDALEIHVNNVRLPNILAMALTQQKGHLTWESFIKDHTPAATLKRFFPIADARERELRGRKVMETTLRVCTYQPPQTPHVPQPEMPMPARAARFGVGTALLASAWLYAAITGKNADIPPPVPVAVPQVQSVPALTTAALRMPELCQIGQDHFRTLSGWFGDCAEMKEYYARPRLLQEPRLTTRPFPLHPGGGE